MHNRQQQLVIASASSPPPPPRAWQQDLARYLATLNAGRTQREYEKAIRAFFQTAGVPQHVSELSYDLLAGYRGALVYRATPHQREGCIAHPLAPATCNMRLSALRGFLVFCVRAGRITHLSADGIRETLHGLPARVRRPYEVLDECEWEAFAAAAAETDTPRTFGRNHACVRLALATGLRAVELASLDVGDLTCEIQRDGTPEWWLVLPDAKTKGQRGGRTLPLAPALVAIVLAYVKTTGRRLGDPRHQKTPLFLSERSADRRLRPAVIRRLVSQVTARWRSERNASGGLLAGENRHISTHALRHSTAFALLQGNDATGRPPASVEHVRGWLGHADIATTQRYVDHLNARRDMRPFAL